MNGKKILIAGCGRIGTQLGRALCQEGARVWGLRRQGALIPHPIQAISADLVTGEGLSEIPQNLDFVVYLTAGGGYSEEAYKGVYVSGLRNLITALTNQSKSLQRIFYVSSTGVYAQTRGEWVDESSPVQPTHPSGEYLLKGEQLLDRCLYPGTVVRFAGIYGPGRTRLLRRVNQGQEPCRDDAAQYANLIHQDDCAAVLQHLLSLPQAEPLYVAVDSEPVNRCKLIGWLARQLDAPPPAKVPPEQLSKRQLRSNKRCRNQRLLQSGYRFIYPNFRSGYAELITDFKRSLDS